jgi:outer membrane protein assembly factor BamB
VVVAATGRSRGYDLATGQELWRLGGMTVNTIPTPVERAGVVFLASGFRGSALQAVALDGAKGDLEGTDAVRWTRDRHTPYVPSLLLYDDTLYFLKGHGKILTALDATTGKEHFTEKRLPGVRNVFASPVGAAGRVYVFGRTGHAVVLRHGPTYEVLAENDLDEGVEATPAVVGDTIYLRTRGHLYAIAEDPSAGP